MRSYRTLRLLTGLVALAGLLIPAGMARADGGGGLLHQVVNGYAVELHFVDEVHPGVVAVQVHLSDAHGQPVPDARVQVVQSLISASEPDSHDAEADVHDAAEEADDHGAADDHGNTTGHPETEQADAHSEPDADHAEADAHAGDAHGEPDGEAQDESVPHTHDESNLFQIAWDGAAAAYTGEVIFFQAGQWAVHVEFTVEGQENVAEFAVDVLRPDPGGKVLAAFAGLNVAILSTAAVLKRKSAAAGRRPGATA